MSFFRALSGPISIKNVHSGGTCGIGFQALSGAVERGRDIAHACCDNGAYRNTGIRRSAPSKAFRRGCAPVTDRDNKDKHRDGS